MQSAWGNYPITLVRLARRDIRSQYDIHLFFLTVLALTTLFILTTGLLGLPLSTIIAQMFNFLTEVTSLRLLLLFLVATLIAALAMSLITSVVLIMMSHQSFIHLHHIDIFQRLATRNVNHSQWVACLQSTWATCQQLRLTTVWRNKSNLVKSFRCNSKSVRSFIIFWGSSTSPKISELHGAQWTSFKSDHQISITTHGGSWRPTCATFLRFPLQLAFSMRNI